MMFMILGVGLFLLPILFRLALKLRLGIPMLYAVLMLTAFHGWYQAHTALADGIFFALGSAGGLAGGAGHGGAAGLPRPAGQGRRRVRHRHRGPLVTVTPAPSAPGSAYRSF